jgi:hypothetical protein
MRSTGRFTTNDVGMRGPPVLGTKPAGKMRIFLVGGSAMECRYIDDNYAIHAQLQRALKARSIRGEIEVAFAGGWAARSYDHLAMLAHRVFHLQPDLILFAGGLGDVFEGLKGSDYLLRFPHPNRRRSTGQLAQMLATEFHLGRLLYRVLHRWRPLSLPLRPENETDLLCEARTDAHEHYRVEPTSVEQYRQNLISALGMARGHGVPLVFVTQPSRLRSRRPELGARRWYWGKYRREDIAAALETYNDAMREIAARMSAPVCDMAAILDGVEECFYDDMHHTIVGAERTGMALAAFIARERLAANELKAAAGPSRPEQLRRRIGGHERTEVHERGEPRPASRSRGL